MRALLFSALVACGPSGSFEFSDRTYSAEKLTAQTVTNEGLTGIDVLLAADPIRQASDDEISVRVTLMWPIGSPPATDKDIALGGAALVALVRIACYCGGKDEAFMEPVVSGKVRFSKLSLDATIEIEGHFDAVFKGQLALISGGILYEDETLTVHVSGFKATK